MLIASVAWAVANRSLDPGGAFPNKPQGPGLTLDESFNVHKGVRLVEAVRFD